MDINDYFSFLLVSSGYETEDRVFCVFTHFNWLHKTKFIFIGFVIRLYINYTQKEGSC